MLDLGLKDITVQLMCGEVKVPVCTKAVWDKIRIYDGSDKAAVQIGGMLLEKDSMPLDLCDMKLLATVYKETMEYVRKQTGLDIPYYPVKKEKNEVKYSAYTTQDKLVADYANMNIYDIDNIPIIDYWLLERDAFISALSKTEAGVEYLNNAYRITQTEADEDLEI